jgi:hypothetical protein
MLPLESCHCMTDNPRTISNKPPLSLVLKASVIGLAALGIVLFATWQFGSSITSAKKTGTVVSKEFRPLDQPENQITLNRDGAVRSDRVEGDYIITVEVPMADGTKKTYTVWLNTKERYEAVNIGDTFSVGPYLVSDQPDDSE